MIFRFFLILFDSWILGNLDVSLYLYWDNSKMPVEKFFYTPAPVGLEFIPEVPVEFTSETQRIYHHDV
jgi:hypothetical protein